MLIPRGKYSLQLYATFAKLHGRTNDYKIQYKDIVKGFLLPKPDAIHMCYVLQLKVPLRQGQTLHHYIALQFEREKIVKVPINLSPEQLKEQYADRLPQELECPLYDAISKLFRELIKINIILPNEFKSFKKDDAIKCSVKASDGYLYPLMSSFIFIHKPVIYVKHSGIKFVEFSRIGQMNSGIPSRSFDMTITSLKDNTSTTFAGIDKAEHKGLVKYLKSKNIKMRSVDVETNEHIDFDDDSDADMAMDDEEEKGGKRVRKAAKNAVALDDDYDDEEDDESFNDEGSPQDSEDDDDSDADGDDDDDVSMDEDDLDDEVKQLQKEAPKLAGKRRGAGGSEPKSDKKSKKKSAGNSQADK